jgi:hypothetical protein
MSSFRSVCKGSLGIDGPQAIQALGLNLAVLLLCLPLLSQTNLGRIFGGITDQRCTL